MPSIARSADIERQLLAPLEALLRDAQVLLDVELDADRLEQAAGATSSESSGHPSVVADCVQSAAQGIARPVVPRFSGPMLHGAVTVDSTQPEALTPKPGAVPKRPFDAAESGFSSPNVDAAMPAELAGARFEQSVRSASSTPLSGSPQAETTNHGAPDHGIPPAPPGSGIPLSPRHTTMDGPNGHGFWQAPKMMKATTVPSLAGRIPPCTPELLDGRGACSANSPSRPPTPLPQAGEGRFASRSRDFHGNEMAPPGHSQPMSREATSTTSAPLPSSATAEYAKPASMRSATPSYSSTLPYFTGPAPLAQSLASSVEHDTAEVPAAEWSLRSGEYPEAPTAKRLSGDSRQPTDAEATPPAAALTDNSQRVSPAPDSHRTLAIPLSPGQAPLVESLASCGEHDAASVPTAERPLSAGKNPEAPTAEMLSGDSRQPTGAEAKPPTAHLASISQHVSPAPDSHRMLAIPLRPRLTPALERSFATAEAANTPMPGSHLQAAARRLASAVEPSLEQAYRLTQARLDTSTASASERIDSPRLVHNTFNVTVALHTDNASASLDPTALADALTEVLRSSARRHGLET